MYRAVRVVKKNFAKMGYPVERGILFAKSL